MDLKHGLDCYRLSGRKLKCKRWETETKHEELSDRSDCINLFGRKLNIDTSLDFQAQLIVKETNVFSLIFWKNRTSEKPKRHIEPHLNSIRTRGWTELLSISSKSSIDAVLPRNPYLFSTCIHLTESKGKRIDGSFDWCQLSLILATVFNQFCEKSPSKGRRRSKPRSRKPKKHVTDDARDRKYICVARLRSVWTTKSSSMHRFSKTFIQGSKDKQNRARQRETTCSRPLVVEFCRSHLGESLVSSRFPSWSLLDVF